MPAKKQVRATSSVAGGNHERSLIDLDGLPGNECTSVLKAFENLGSGCALEVMSARRPNRVFFELQNRFGPEFYWWPLERGPNLWRVMLMKPAPLAHRTVVDVMNAYQDRLNQLWSEFVSAVEMCRTDEATRHAAELALGLRRYVDIEEALLFPLLEAHLGIDEDSPAAAMHKEHREIAYMADELDKLRATTDCATILRIFDQSAEPLEFFLDHCRREKAVLYTLMGRVFSDAENGELMSLVQAFEI